MGFSPYSQIVAPPEHVDLMDLNLLLKGTQYKQQQEEKNFNEIQGQINNVLAIPAYGKDKEILNQKIQELQQVMGGLNVSELGTPQAKQQINSLINQFSQDKDVQAIANRGYTYEKMIADKKEAEKKGGKYINYGIDDLNSYYSGDNYIRDVKFSNDGYLGADVGKVMEDIKKTMTPTKITRKLPNGEVITEEQYDNKALLENTKLQLQNTNWEKEIKDRTKRKYANENIDDYALQQAGQLESVATQNLNNAYYIYGDPSSTKEQKEKAVADIQKSQETLSKVNSIKNNPYHGQAFLLGEIDDEKNKSIGKVAEALNYRQESLPKLDEAYKMAEEHKHDFAIKAQESANKQQEEIFKLRLKTGLSQLENETTTDYINRLATEAQKKDLEIAQAKQDIKTEAAVHVEETKQKGRLEIIDEKNNKLLIKDNGAKQIKVKDSSGNEEYVDKKTVLEEVQREDVGTIEKIINTNPEEFGNTSGVDPKGWFDGGVWITTDEKTGIKYANYEANAVVGGTKYKIPLTDIQKYVADPNHIVTVFSEDDNYKAPLKGSVENIGKSNADIPTSTDYKQKATLGKEDIYSNDNGETWYKKNGTKVEQ